jgi:peptidoglycan/LPS O-acetylase OafA/YrhL
MNDAPKSRLAQLDFLRALAIFMVIGNHSAICPPEFSSFLNQITTIWYRGGWAGVDLFFVLSGFLISGLLFNEYKTSGDIDIKRFLIRRGFKIYPAFWFFIFIALIVTILNQETVYRGGFVCEILFIQNYHPGIWNHTWSLAVEEHFYIFLSFLFFILLITNKNTAKNSFAIIPRLFLAIAVACLLNRCLAVTYAPFSYSQNIEPTHLRVDSLFFGVFLSYLWNFKGLSESEFLNKHKLLIGLIGVACFLPAFIFELNDTPWMWSFGLMMLYLGAGCLLLALLKSNFTKNSLLESFASVGKYSYSVYLWNLPIHFWLTKFTNLAAENWLLYAFFYWAGTFILGIGTAKLVEYPILKLRDKWMPSQVSALKTV